MDTEAQTLLAVHLRELFPDADILMEVQFDDARKWKFDIVVRGGWYKRYKRFAFECNGGLHTGGHRRGRAMEDEYEKLNTAIRQGWLVFQFSNRQILCGEARKWIADNLV